MLRLAEILLFLTPFALFALWRVLAPYRDLSRGLLGVAAGVIAALIVILLWYRDTGSLSPHTDYVPPSYKDGHIIPGHAASP